MVPDEASEPSHPDTVEAAEEILLTAHDRLIHELKHAPGGYRPVFPSDGDNRIELAAMWAAGFHAGMQLRLPAWKALVATEAGQDMLGPIILLARDPEGRPQTASFERLAKDLGIEVAAVPGWLADQIPGCVREIFEHWRRQDRQPRRSASDFLTGRIGRNDPCPCGSGKKYKKCCLN